MLRSVAAFVIATAAWSAVFAADKWDGDLTVTAPAAGLEAGAAAQITIAAVGSDGKPKPKVVADRAAAFHLVPYRWNLFEPPTRPLAAVRVGPDAFTVTLPGDLPTGWYLLITAVADDDGRLLSVAEATASDRTRRFLDRMPVVVRGTDVGGPFVRVHAERGRCVFSPGERLRLFLSARGKAGVTGNAAILITAGGRSIPLATGTLAAAPGREQVMAFDVDQHVTAAIPPGDHDLVATLAGKDLDRVPVRFVAARRPSGGGRWAHTMPSGNASGFDGAAVLPERLAADEFGGHAERVAAGIHQATLWVNFFANAWPILGPDQALPEAEAADLPPAAAEYRPAHTHALYQKLMAEGIALGVFLGYGEDYKAEVYMPLPTIDPKQQAVLARKYLAGSLAAATLPNFVAAYTDAYGHMDWNGGGELSTEEFEGVRHATWEAAAKAAGIAPAPELPEKGGLPTLSDPVAAAVGRDAAYRFASFALRGIERCYAAITSGVEAELPAVFTIHNKGTMNHSVAPHAWTGFRTPNIDQAYMLDGATAVSVSEWNLDAVPKPYFLPTFHVQGLVDRGLPVYQCGLWKQMGSPSRFMRDTVFWMGRGIQTYFDQTDNLTWSHIGADQTTYASNERLAAVAGFHAAYSDVVPRLEPVREVGIYVPPIGDPWGHATTRGSTVAILASLMTGWQAHMVSHGALEKPAGLGRYPVIYAASIGPDSLYPFEEAAFRRYVADGGAVVVSQAPNYYHKPEVYERYGIAAKQVRAVDRDGNPQTNKDGTPKMTSEWTETPGQWARLTRETVWGFLDDRVVPAAIDVNLLFTHRDDAGKPATWSGSHWTGHQEWAKYRGSALDQHEALAEAFAAIREPIVRKDHPEVFVDVTRPRDGGAGYWVFASNWTLPDEPDLFTQRVPQGFFNSSVKPVRARIALKLDGAGAVYDVLAARRVETAVEENRLAFTADFSTVEGRVFAVLPEPVAGATLTLPAEARAGEPLRARFALRGESGRDLGVLGAVRLELLDAAGAVIISLDRALPPDGRLPEVPLPAGGAVTVRVIDTVAGFSAAGRLTVQGPAIAPAVAAAPVTVHRGDRVHDLLRAAELVVAWDAGKLTFKDGKKSVSRPNPQAARDRGWAERLAAVLAKAGVATRVAGTDELAAGPLFAHPWTGRMAGYRTRHTVPDVRIDAPVVLVGDPATSPLLDDLERSWVAGRSLGRDQVGPGRAVVAFQPKAFSPALDAVVVAVADDAGLEAAAGALAATAQARPDGDPTFAARERLRFDWLPAEVALFKQGRGLLSAPPAPAAMPKGMEVEARLGWPGLAGRFGQAVVSIDASPAGVVVGTKSWAAPTVLITADGSVRGAWGGGAEVTPRDVGISADGLTAWAGYSLMGRLAAYRPGTGRLFSHPTPVVHKANPFEWDSFKDSDRHLGMSPDKAVAIGQVAGSLVAFDPATGAERWRIAGHSSAAAPRGTPMPEVGFSADGRFALVTATVADGRRDVRFTVQRKVWDAAARRYDRKTEPAAVAATTTAVRRDLRLVEAATGKTVWSRPVAFTLLDATTGAVVWQPGKPPQQEVTDPQTDNRPQTWAGDKDDVPVDTATGKPVAVPELLDLGMWHLSSAVGPAGAWSVTGTREAAFALLDDQGNLLRRFEARDLPGELAPGQMIPPTLLPSRDPAKVLVFAPQARAAFVFRITVGSAEERATARQLVQENRALVDTIRTVLGDRKQYARFDDTEWMRGFARDLAAVPADLRGELLAQMGRVSAEGKAGRKRGPEWFTAIVQRIDARLHAEDAPALAAAVGLEQIRRIDLPAMISDVRADGRLDTLYAGLWDGTVRSIATADGRQHWSAPVAGGARLAVVADPAGAVTGLYAGGSRGDVTRIDPASGAVLWTVPAGAGPPAP